MLPRIRRSRKRLTWMACNKRFFRTNKYQCNHKESSRDEIMASNASRKHHITTAAANYGAIIIWLSHSRHSAYQIHRSSRKPTDLHLCHKVKSPQKERAMKKVGIHRYRSLGVNDTLPTTSREHGLCCQTAQVLDAHTRTGVLICMVCRPHPLPAPQILSIQFSERTRIF